MNLEIIEELTGSYSVCHYVLAKRVQQLQDEIEAVKRRHMPGIREAVGLSATARRKLETVITNNPSLFRKPKTHIFHGIRVGYVKQRGRLVIDDSDAVIARIRKALPEEQAVLLIRTREEVDKNALGDLKTSDLKRIGVEVTSDKDVVVIKPVDGEVDKLIAALLKDAEAESSNEEAAA